MDLDVGVTEKEGGGDHAGHFPCEADDGDFCDGRHDDSKTWVNWSCFSQIFMLLMESELCSQVRGKSLYWGFEAGT